MTIRYTQSNESFPVKRIGGMTFFRSITTTTKKEAVERAEYHRARGAKVRVIRNKSKYELWTS